MLTPEEVKQVGAEMTRVIEATVNPQFEAMRKQIGLEMCQVIEDNVNPQFEELRGEIKGIKDEIIGIKGEIKEIKETMVTKEYLDKKFAQDMQLRSLVDLLQAKQLITPDEVKRLFIVNPFPQAA